MKQRTPAQKRLIAAAFAGLLLFLALLLWQGIRRGDAVRVGVPKSAQAMGAGMLLQTPSAQYHCTLGSTPEALATALRQGELDAALLPYETAKSVEGCQLRAVLGEAEPVVEARQRVAAGHLRYPPVQSVHQSLPLDVLDTVADELHHHLQDVEFGKRGGPVHDHVADADLLRPERIQHQQLVFPFQ